MHNLRIGLTRKFAGEPFRIIKGRPGITNAELANILGISPRAVGKHLKKLRNDNRIVRVGSPTYGGGWEILEE